MLSFIFFVVAPGIRDFHVTGVQTCALPICAVPWPACDHEPGSEAMGARTRIHPRGGATGAARPRSRSTREDGRSAVTPDRAAASKVIVVGAGAAGLAAADALRRAGAAVVIVEARDRIGGRVDSRIDPSLGIAVERGAEFVHGRPPRITALARRSGAPVRAVPERH